MDKFREDGFIELDNCFADIEISELESVITKFFISQALKIGEYRELALSVKNDSSLTNKDRFASIYEAMEENDKEALYQVQNFFPSSQSARKIFSDEFLKVCANYMDVSDVDLLLVEGPAVFVNRPNTERLLYKWHAEAHYYPKRRNFLNVWFPVFCDKTKGNGTMSFKVSSHKRDFPFAEYSGFNKDSENTANYFKQFDIPSNLLESYEEHFCETGRGSVVLFDRRLVHRSNNNSSSDYSVSIVARIWEHSNDVTLSGSMSSKPYGGDIGRSDFYVSDL
jgi:hypothetical protein